LLQGNVFAAQEELNDLIPRMDASLGADNASVLTVRLNLAHVHQLSGDLAAALRELRLILSLCGQTGTPVAELIYDPRHILTR
jgi:hypothetical protein